MVRPALRHFTHFPEAFLLKRQVADGEHFVHEQDFRLEVRGDGKRQAHLHSRAVMLQRRVDEIGDFGKGDDLVEFAVDFLLAHAENRAVQIRIFAAGQLGVKARADFQQAAHAAANFSLAFGGLRDAGKNLQQRGFSGAVAADQADDFALAAIQTKRRAAPRCGADRRRNRSRHSNSASAPAPSWRAVSRSRRVRYLRAARRCGSAFPSDST